jgi:hypothetical protein
VKTTTTILVLVLVAYTILAGLFIPPRIRILTSIPKTAICMVY